MSAKRVTAFIAIGANLNDPERRVREGVAALAGLPDTELVRASSLYRSAPVGYRDQPDFINAVAEVRTGLSARALLEALLALEVSRGRVRTFLNAPRTLDLDIVVFGDLEIHEPGLTVPHPRMQDRAFVVVPLAEIAPEAMVPGRGRARELVAGVDATSLVKLAPVRV
jgi:2-amino-4-hydroxy-6-hydroxymethyldihydropteridine diphosphokinase